MTATVFMGYCISLWAARHPVNGAPDQRFKERIFPRPCVMRWDAAENFCVFMLEGPDQRAIGRIDFSGGENLNAIGVANQRPVWLVQHRQIDRVEGDRMVCVCDFERERCV